MMLSNESILEAVRARQIEFKPEFNEQNLRATGVRVHLGNELLIPKAGQTINFDNPVEIAYDHHDLTTATYCLRPGGFLLACTVEQIKTSSNLIAVLDGRSTMARLGLTIHNSAALLDGPAGEWIKPVLEIKNHGNFDIQLKGGLAIAMIFFLQFKGAILKDNHKSPYSGPTGTMAPQI